jgi:glutaconyl-CoA/methylmalonyl-CoA decarboxylase subunit delta
MDTILLNIGGLSTDKISAAFAGLFFVIVAFVLVYFIFLAIARINEWLTKTRLKRSGQPVDQTTDGLQLSSGVDAAISAAIYLYLSDIHDKENAVMTIKKVSKAYSPWSSKIYSVRWPLK